MWLEEHKSVVTVREILNRTMFKTAKLVAGERGLDRPIRWVHIIEVADFDPLINGEELILTTGVAFNLEVCGKWIIERMHKLNISALCIKLGSALESVSDEMIETAERLGLPLIVFFNSVRFIDITQDLHTLIIHRVLDKLEKVSREFSRITLTAQGINSVLKLLSSSTSSESVYMPIDKNPIYYPSMSQKKKNSYFDFLKSYLPGEFDEIPNSAPHTYRYGDKTMIAQAAGAFGKTWAYIVIIIDRKPHEYDFMILDAACLSISQSLLRKRFIEERRIYTENLWVDDLIHLRIKDENHLKTFIGNEFKQLDEANHQVCIIEAYFNDGEDLEEFDESAATYVVHLSVLLSSILKQHRYYPLITLKKTGLVAIMIDQDPNRTSPLEGLKSVFHTLLKFTDNEHLGNVNLNIGIGGIHTQLLNVHQSYQEAIHALSMCRYLEQNIVFFDELGIFRLLLKIDRSVLEAFVYSYIKPLVDYDQTRGSELLKTLAVYLDSDGTKADTAEKLFIVRQSLYYRLNKIKELLGPEFMNPENRIALQVSIQAWQLLSTETE